jgi:osmotically-inducible protein OsmY
VQNLCRPCATAANTQGETQGDYRAKGEQETNRQTGRNRTQEDWQAGTSKTSREVDRAAHGRHKDRNCIYTRQTRHSAMLLDKSGV